MRKWSILRLSPVTPCCSRDGGSLIFLEQLPRFSALWSHKIFSRRTLRMSRRYPPRSLKGGDCVYTPELPPTTSAIPFAGNCLTGNIREMGRLVRPPLDAGCT